MPKDTTAFQEVVLPNGSIVGASGEELADLKARGAVPAQASEVAKSDIDEKREQEFGGAGKAILLGGARGLTLGLSDLLVSDRTKAGIDEQSPGIALGAEIVTGVGAAVLSGGTSAAISGGRIAAAGSRAVRAARAVSNITPAGRLASVAGRGGAAVGARLGRTAGLAAEGAVDFAGAAAVSATARALVSDDPFSIETLASEIGTSAVLGAGAGGALGLLGKGLSKLARPSKVGKAAAAPENIARREFGTLGKEFERGAEEIGDLARKIPGAPEVELGQVLSRRAAVRGLGEGSARTTKEALDSTRRLDNFVKAAQDFDSAAGTNLTPRVFSLEQVISDPSVLARVDELSLDNAATILGTKIPDNLSGPAERFLKANALILQAEAALPAASKSVISRAAESAGRAVGRRAASAVVGGVVGGPVGGLIGGIAGDQIGAILGTVASRGARIASGVGKFLKSSRGGTAAVRASNTGRKSPGSSAPNSKQVKASPLTGERIPKGEDSTRFVLREIASIGSNPDALRRQLADRLAPVIEIDPRLADNIIENTVRRFEFLAAESGPQTAEDFNLRADKRGLSSQVKNRLARMIRAMEDPASIVDDLNSGRLHRQAVDTVRQLYPATFERIQQELFNQIEANPAQLNYQARIQLNLLFDIPIEPTLQPQFVQAVQTMYQQRLAEQAQPARGVPKSPDKPTTAQRLESR